MSSVLDLEELLESERFASLERALADAAVIGRLPPLEATRLRGELALRGRGPLADLAVAARTLASTATPETAARLASNAARLLFKAGARATSSGVLDAALRRWPRDESVQLAREQIAARRVAGATRSEWTIDGLLREGRVREAAARAEELASSASLGGARVAGLQLLADLRCADAQFAEVVSLLERIDALRPRADDAPAVRLSIALARWASGDRGAVEALKKLRELTAPPLDLEPRAWDEEAAIRGSVHVACARLLGRLDARPERRDAGPRWIPRRPYTPPCRPGNDGAGAGVVTYVLTLFGTKATKPIGTPSTIPHVRQALEAHGLVTRRVVVDESVVASVLEVGGVLILEEERSTDTGFSIVAGFEPVAGLLLLVVPPRPGAVLVDAATHLARCELSGHSALLVTGTGPAGEAKVRELEARGVRHQRKLEAIDACHIDAQGTVPPRARITELASSAVDLAPEIPLGWLRLGESLVAQMRAGQLDAFVEGERLTRWYADVRERFPDAEWPFQIYAQLLELQDRSAEAGIAWAGAADWDPFDYRNFLGQAQACAVLGDLASAERHARRAASLEPSSADVLASIARIVLDREGPGVAEEAATFADMACDIAPSNTDALDAKASAEERRGRGNEAAELLAKIAEAEPRNPFVRLRILRRHVHAGDWEPATTLAKQVCTIAPGLVGAWIHASGVAFASGRGRDAIDLATAGLERCGPNPVLIHAAVTAAASFLSSVEARGVAHRLVRTFGGSTRAVLEVAADLGAAGLEDEAEALARRAVESAGGRGAPAWFLARALMRKPGGRSAHRDEIARLLDGLIAESPRAPLPRILRAWVELDVDPARALALLEQGELEGERALGWHVSARALAAARKPDRAARLRERFREVYPRGIVDPVHFLCGSGLAAEALELADGAVAAFPGDVPAKVVRAVCLSHLGKVGPALKEALAGREIDSREVPRELLTKLAHVAQDWAALALVAQEEADEGTRSSSKGDLDTWPTRARVAGAKLARGDAGPRRTLVESARRHPAARAILCDIERRIGSPLAAEDEKELDSFAPGARRVLEADLR